ncbi:MAG: DUF2807 domain-containing protein [Myxococcales bacterium]|nr:DUF2807 domain-containing protein [Myxococcales bacterium]
MREGRCCKIQIALGLGLLIAGCGVVGCSVTGVEGNGVEGSAQRKLGAFSTVSVGGAFALDLRRGSPQKVVVRGDANLLPLVETTVESGRLRVRCRKSVSPRRGLRLEVVTPTLDGLALSGAAKGTVHGVDSKRFVLRISGAAKLALDGKADALSVTSSGAAKVDARALKVRAAKVHASGAAKVDVDASETLDVQASGAVAVSYSGSPKLTQSLSGACRLTKR